MTEQIFLHPTEIFNFLVGMFRVYTQKTKKRTTVPHWKILTNTFEKPAKKKKLYMYLLQKKIYNRTDSKKIVIT